MIDIKKNPKSEIEVAVTVPWEDWKGHIDSAVESLAGEIKTAGFRPGKAPRSLVEQRVGRDTVLHEAADRAIRKSWEKIVQDEKLEAIGAPKAEMKKLAEGNDLEYVITTAVMPTAKLKKEWRDAVKKVNAAQAGKSAEVSDEDVQKELEKLATSRAKLVTVDRAAKKGDSARLDFDVLQGGVPIENGSAKDHALVLGSGVFIPGFEEKIEGMKAGEETEFTLPFPEEYHEKSLAGKDATFKVKVNVVEERRLPEMNDEFAQSLGKFETLEALKKSIREGMEHEAKHKQKDEHRGEITDAVVSGVEVDIPDVLVEHEVEQMLGNFEAQIQTMGMEMDTYLAQIKKTREDLEKEWRPQAEKRVKANFSLREIAKDQEIKPEAAEIEEEMNKTLSRLRSMKDMEKKVDMQRLYTYAEENLITEKVFQTLEKM